LDLLVSKFVVRTDKNLVYESRDIEEIIEMGELGEANSNAIRKIQVHEESVILPKCFIFTQVLGLSELYSSV